ncbi:MAG: response regulator [Phycisphaerales bacterium]|nr:response regulator [Phycisphaerales bacterium]
MKGKKPSIHVVIPPALVGSDSCEHAADLKPVEDLAQAIRDSAPGDCIADAGASMLLRGLGTAAAMVNHSGEVSWADDRFNALPEAVRDEMCRQVADRRSPRIRFELEERLWELHIADCNQESIGILLVDASAAAELIRRRAAIDAAGMSLLRLDRQAVAQLSVADRLQRLDVAITEAVHANLDFDHFEIRLLSPDTNRLELVISEAISPMRVGEVLYAEAKGNGISGWVAATGRPYLCRDVRTDPLYEEGLDEAMCSLTVPLKVGDRVIGVFNIECDTAGVLDETDLELSIRFGEYVASALHLLDLLVVERITTSEATANRLTETMAAPLKALRALQSELVDAGHEAQAGTLQQAVDAINACVDMCAAGPRSVIDAEQDMRTLQAEPALQGRSVVVVEDEERIRDEVTRIMTQLGCTVAAFPTGGAFFGALKDGLIPELVLSDIRLGDSSGYEVLTAAREAAQDVPVVLMTGFGYDPNHTIVRASAEGVQGVLLKPFRVHQLVDAMRAAITGETANRR